MEGARFWTAIGAADVGGILVREECSTKSPMKGRLPVGTIVEGLEQVRDRLRFAKVSGDGPSSGWVSLHSGRGVPLLEPYEGAVAGDDAEAATGPFEAFAHGRKEETLGLLPDLAPPTLLPAAPAPAGTAPELPGEQPAPPFGGRSSTAAPARGSSLVLPGRAALEAWFDELAMRAQAYRPCTPASNLATNAVPSMFLIFSSMSGLLGLSRSFEYATSNSFLDALMHFRHKQGLSGREMHIGNVHSIGMSAANPSEGFGVSPAMFGQIFTNIISHVEYPGAEIFETPEAFPQMGRNLGIIIPYLRNYDAKHAAMEKYIQAQQGLDLKSLVEEVEKPITKVEVAKEIEQAASDPARRRVMQEANTKLTTSLDDLRADPDMQDFFAEVKRFGPDAAKKFVNDEKVLKKFAMATAGLG